MNRSKPATVLGGGEMNRLTSAVVSSSCSDGASDSRSSRNVTPFAQMTGRRSRQSVAIGAMRAGPRVTSVAMAW